MAIKEGGTFETFRDPNGNVLASINRDGSVLAQAIDFGDGTVQTTAAAGGGAVSSVFGRTGAVVAAINDYTAAQLAVGALPDGVTATTQASTDSSTKVATTAYVLSTKFNPTIVGVFAGETTQASPVFGFNPGNYSGAGLFRISCYCFIVTPASTSFTVGSVVTNYTTPVEGILRNFTVPAATLVGGSALGANASGANYSTTFCVASEAGANITITWNGTLSDGGGTFDRFVYMTAELIAHQ
jgi:hypothetical protein